MTPNPLQSDQDDEGEGHTEEQEKPQLSSNGQDSTRQLIIRNGLILAVALVVAVAANLSHHEHESALYLVAGFSVLGLLLAQMMQMTTTMEKEWPFLAVIALPAVLYLVFAGYVTGLKVPGGLEVELRELLQEVPDIDRRLEGAELDNLFEESLSRADCKGNYNAVVLVGEKLDQGAGELVQLLLCNRNLNYVVFEDSDRRFLGMFEADRVIESLANDDEREKFEDNLKKPGAENLLNYLEQVFGTNALIKSSVDSAASTGQILQRMNDENVEAVAMTDTKGRVLAVIEREELMSQLMIKFAGFDETPAPTSTPAPSATSAPSPTQPLSLTPTPIPIEEPTALPIDQLAVPPTPSSLNA